MSNPISDFFDAWQETNAEIRRNAVSDTVLDSVEYADPRTPEIIRGVQAVSDYLGMFSANAPGWSAKVVKQDETTGFTRVTVAFGGPGPDGKEQVQYGQYFVEKDGEKISRMIGFVGIGEPE